MGSFEIEPPAEERSEDDAASELTSIFDELAVIFDDEQSQAAESKFEIDQELVDFLEEAEAEEHIDPSLLRINYIRVYAMGMRAVLSVLKSQLGLPQDENAQ